MKREILCEKCGKRLMCLTEDGFFHFIFGKDRMTPTSPLINMVISGAVKLKCYRYSNGHVCGHMNIVSVFKREDGKIENIGNSAPP